MDDLQILPIEVKRRLEQGEQLLIVDVREPSEFQICRIEGAKLIPLSALPEQVQSLPDDEEVICYCHHGIRSLDAVVWLRQQGIERARSLAGGIERWSMEIDPNVPRY